MAKSNLSSEDIQPYDFRRPPWISRERRAVLEGVHTKLTPALDRLLTAALRRPVRVMVHDAAQVSFGDWRRNQVTPVVAYLIPLASGEGGNALVRLDVGLAHQLLDALLGGSGDAGERPETLTPLEQAILGRLVDDFVKAVSAGYSTVAPFTPAAPQFEPIAESLTAVDLHERVLLLEFAVASHETAGVLTLVLPAARIESFTRGQANNVAPMPHDPVAARQIIEQQLRNARIPVVARLSGHRITARDGAALKVGQVLASNHHFEGNVELHINNRPRFLGALGRNQGKVGLRILQVVDSNAIPSRLLRRTS